ncbi:hypothetical protein C8J57DRAFT_991840, partial [Mycena rebaudengoi]
FIISLDFFPPYGSRRRSASASIGVLSIACLMLPPSLRYRPENMLIHIIPGEVVPHQEEINGYMRPIIDEAVLGWERGFHLSTTAGHPNG